MRLSIVYDITDKSICIIVQNGVRNNVYRSIRKLPFISFISFVYFLHFAIESDNSICITVAAGNSDKPKEMAKW